MLVLSRKVGERILIGDKIAITIVRIGQGGVRVGIEAPIEMPVVREELAAAIEAGAQARCAQASTEPGLEPPRSANRVVPR